MIILMCLGAEGPGEAGGAGGSVGDPAVDRESAPGDCPQGMAPGEDRGIVEPLRG